MKEEMVFPPSLVSLTTGFPYSQVGCCRQLERQRQCLYPDTQA